MQVSPTTMWSSTWMDPLRKQLEQAISGRDFSASGTNYGQFGAQSGSGTVGANGTSSFDLFEVAGNYNTPFAGGSTGAPGGATAGATGASGAGTLGGTMAGVAAFAPYAAPIMAGMQMADGE